MGDDETIEDRLLAIGHDFMAEPLSQGITDMERAGELMCEAERLIFALREDIRCLDCPYAIHGAEDKSTAWCVNGGHCGCGRNKLLGVRKGHGYPAGQDWQPIVSAPQDGTLILVWAPGVQGLSDLFSVCAWHPDAGFCIDELRSPTHWQSLPSPPRGAE